MDLAPAMETGLRVAASVGRQRRQRPTRHRTGDLARRPATLPLARMQSRAPDSWHIQAAPCRILVGAFEVVVMQVVSNAFFDQAEVVQADRWEFGPLELVFVDVGEAARPNRRERLDAEMHIATWNRHSRGGFLRDADACEFVFRRFPAIQRSGNPNIVLVPRIDGCSELDVMLASIVPDRILEQFGIAKIRTSTLLLPYSLRSRNKGARTYGLRAREAFSRYIWSELAPRRGCSEADFAEDSPLRLLADDHLLWASRLYRLALDRSDGLAEVGADPGWEPLEVIDEKLRSTLPPDQSGKFVVRRPLFGGDLWNMDDPSDCDAMVDDLLDGARILSPIDSVLDVLRSHYAHEDFSARYSWIKEDFERAFYHKRAPVKVTFVETVDDHPVWHADGPAGYGNVLFRDVLARLDPRDRRIVVALRLGKTVSEIASEEGLRGHSGISKRLRVIKRRMRRTLGMGPEPDSKPPRGGETAERRPD